MWHPLSFPRRILHNKYHNDTFSLCYYRVIKIWKIRRSFGKSDSPTANVARTTFFQTTAGFQLGRSLIRRENITLWNIMRAFHTVFQVDWPGQFYWFIVKFQKFPNRYDFRCSWHKLNHGMAWKTKFLFFLSEFRALFSLSLTAHLLSKISKLKWIKHCKTTEFEYWIISSCIKNKESIRKERFFFLKKKHLLQNKRWKIWKQGQIMGKKTKSAKIKEYQSTWNVPGG